MEYPKITIVTPNFNGEKFIEETILSVINQKYPNLEYIVIDGGSTDSSVDIIKKYQKHLSYWVSEPDQGLYFAIQKGFNKSTGEIMGWINSDDKLHRNALHEISRLFIENSNVNWIQGIPNTFDEYGNHTGEREHYSSKYIFYLKYYKLSLKYLIQQESTFWTRNLWNNAGGHISVEYKLAGDFELWMRFFRYSELYNTNHCLGSFRIKEQQLSENINLYKQEADMIINRELLLLSRIDKFHIFRAKIFRKLNKGNIILRNFLLHNSINKPKFI